MQRTETNRIEFKRELTRVFRDVEMVESLGSGMNRIMRIYGRDNFEFGDNYVRMVVPYNWIPEEVEADNGNDLEKFPENVLENVLETSESLANCFGVNERTIRRDLQYLQKQGLIRHVGPDKGGKWQVINKR